MAEMDKWVSAECVTHVVPKTQAGVPTLVDAAVDFKVHPGYQSDGQFIAADLKTADGREFGIMLHIMCVNPMKDPEVYPGMLSIISMTDFTNDTYTFKEDVFMGPDRNYSLEGLDCKTPISYIKGDINHIVAGTDLPNGIGRIDLDMVPTKPALYNCALGEFPFLNDEVHAYQYSLPEMDTKGTLTIDGETYEVTGTTWLDRQWGDGNIDFANRTFKWKWMNLQLDDGTKISCWDVVPHDKKENCWATVMLPTGAHIVVAMTPWEVGEGDIYVGATGQMYPTSYKLAIPSLDAEFDVKVRGLKEQEIVSQTGEDKYEAACTFTGKFMGKPCTGKNYVELVGSYK